MKKKAAFYAIAISLMLVLTITAVPPARTIQSGNTWYEYKFWGDNVRLYGDHPENASTSAFRIDYDGDHWFQIGLAASVYEYAQFMGDDCVNFRLALYFDSFASTSLPVPIPVPADFVTFTIQKDTGGSNLNSQTIHVIDYAPTGFGPGYSQGRGLGQSLSQSSDPNQRALWALDALAFSVGLFFEPIDVAWDLINLASGWAPQPGVDYDNAETSETTAMVWWHNYGYDFGTQNPVRQYAFNSIQWIQDDTVNPETYYGLKISARVGLVYPNPFDLQYIDMPPVYLKIYPNLMPGTPSQPTGPTSGFVSRTYSYSTSTVDPDGDYLQYEFNWDDGSTYTTAPVASGTPASASHSWSSPGTYHITARAKDEHGNWGDSSTFRTVRIDTASGPIYTLTIDARDQDGGMVPTEVWVDGAREGDPWTVRHVEVEAGTHTIQVEDEIYVGPHLPCMKYTFLNWNDGVSDNPRTVNVQSDVTYTAMYYGRIVSGKKK